MDPLSLFSKPTRAYFRAAFGRADARAGARLAADRARRVDAPPRADRLGQDARRVPRRRSISSRRPTGTGGEARRRRGHSPRREATRVLYVSPLKALAVDVERNLRAPLAGIARSAVGASRSASAPATRRKPSARGWRGTRRTSSSRRRSRSISCSRPTRDEILTARRDGDRRRDPPAREQQARRALVRLARATRGAAHERRTAAAHRPLRDAEAARRDRAPARRLRATARRARSTIVDAGEPKKLVSSVSAPDIDMSRIGQDDEVHAGSAAASAGRHSIWPQLHPRIVELIRAHRSTMIFVNSRRLAERLATALNDLAGEEIALAHHGSVAREKRAMIEERLKRGDLPAIVATSSLELGIDMGAVDLVIQVEAPPSIASGMQRIGRASHHVGGVPRGVLMPKHRADLLACAAAAAGMNEGAIEETFYPQEPARRRSRSRSSRSLLPSRTRSAWTTLYALVRRAAPFADLPRSAFDGVLDMLAGPLPVRRVRRAAPARRLGPREEHRTRALEQQATRDRQRRHHSRSRPLRRLLGDRGRKRRQARRRARRRDGVRAPRG